MNNNEKIRIAYIIDNLGKGGTQTALIHLIQQLSQKNYQQQIYCLNNLVHQYNRKALLECGVEIKIVGKLQLVTGLGLMRILYDCIHWKPTILFTVLFYSDIIGRLTAKMTHCPIIISSIRARNIYKNQFQLYLDRLTACWADKIIFNTRQAIPFAMKNEGIQQEQIIYIPNGVNVSLFTKNNTNYSKKRKELGISENSPVISSIGRLNPQKGFPYLLQAFQIVQTQFPHSILLIIGAGPLLKTLESLVEKMNLSDNVKFLGERTDIPELLSCTDIYVQSSLFEGMPNAVMEAMATGKSVVATSVDGTLELIEEGKTGWLVEPENSEALAEKICYVLNDLEMAEKVGTAAAERMTKEFSIEKMAQSYDNLFRQLIKEKL